MQVAFDITALLLAICPERKKKCVCLCVYMYKGTLIASTFCIMAKYYKNLNNFVCQERNSLMI